VVAPTGRHGSVGDRVKPRLFDAACKAGGCTKGYQRAGFYVVGCDIEAQPNFCGDEFIQGDMLEVLADYEFMSTFDAAHASPPCQAYIRSGNVARDGRHPKLIGPVRELLEATGLPYVIENVPGAELRPDVVLCGSMFGLEVRRHRWFESNVSLPPWVLACNHSTRIAGVYGHPHGQGGAAKGMLPGDLETWSRAMGIDWMTAPELADAIPPAYCEFIGAQLLAHIESERMTA
jgi:DNA (cytosine-5)-methyltransferase 1